MELKFFKFYFRQLLVIVNTYFAENDRIKKKKECELYFKPKLLNFIVRVCLALKKKFPSQYKG